MSKKLTSRKRNSTSGRFIPKRSDTLIKSIEKQYNMDLGVRSDMKLGNYLKEKGLPSLSKLIGEKKKKKS